MGTVTRTAEGNLASFRTCLKRPLESLKVTFGPVQEGSGDPSPTNVRAISGRTGVTAIINGNSKTVSWQDEAGTMYGGYVDLVTGELVATHKKATFDGSSDFTVMSSSLYVVWQNIADMASGIFYSDPYVMCDKCIKVSARGDVDSNVLGMLFGYNNSSIYMYNLNKYAGTTGDSATVRAWLNENPIIVTYPLATPIHYQLTPQQIETLIGRNNIWSEQGPVSVQYLDKDTKDLLWAQRRAMMSVIPKIGGLPLLMNNARYNVNNDRKTASTTHDENYVVVGPFDTGASASRSYTIKTMPMITDTIPCMLRVYNDLSAVSLNNYTISTTGDTRTITGLAGRYFTVTLPRMLAPNFYMYDNTNNRYVCKGSNVIDVTWNQQAPVLDADN